MGRPAHVGHSFICFYVICGCVPDLVTARRKNISCQNWLPQINVYILLSSVRLLPPPPLVVKALSSSLHFSEAAETRASEWGNSLSQFWPTDQLSIHLSQELILQLWTGLVPFIEENGNAIYVVRIPYKYKRQVESVFIYMHIYKCYNITCYTDLRFRSRIFTCS